MTTTSSAAVTASDAGERIPITVWACGHRPEPSRIGRVGFTLARRLVTELTAPDTLIGVDGEASSALALLSAAKHYDRPVFPLASESEHARHAGRAGLVVLVPPPLGTERATAPSVRAATATYAAAVGALAPGGVCAVVTRHIRRHGRLRDQAAAHVRLAHQADLVYVQHIVAIRAHIDDDTLIPPSWEGSEGPRKRRRLPAAFGPHDDVLLLTKPAAAAAGEAARGEAA